MPRSTVGFFGSGGPAGSPPGTDHPAYFELATIMFACPFLPSTGAILQQDEKLSTFKVCANATYFCVGIVSSKLHTSNGLSSMAKNCPRSIHIFFTEP
jgi:hypothetical protein